MSFRLEKEDNIEKGWGIYGTMPILDWSTFIREGEKFPLSETDRSKDLPIGSTEIKLMSQECVRRTAVDNYRLGYYLQSYRGFKKCFMKFRDPRSITSLGYLLEHGKGVKMNRKRAMICYKLGSQYGDPLGTKMVSWGYLWGLDDLPDMKKAAWNNANVKDIPYFSIQYEVGFA